MAEKVWYWKLIKKLQDVHPGPALKKLREGRQRKEQDAKIADVAAFVGLKVSSLQSYEKGIEEHLIAPKEVMTALAARLFVDLDDFPKIRDYYLPKKANSNVEIMRPTIRAQEESTVENQVDDGKTTDKIVVEVHSDLEEPIQVEMNIDNAGHVHVFLYGTDTEVRKATWMPAATNKYGSNDKRYTPTLRKTIY